MLFRIQGFLTCVLLAAVSLAAEAPSSRPTAQSLFDGRTLAGWKQVGGGKWSVQNGRIVGETGNGEYGWLVFEKPLADFELELQCRHEAPGNSGTQFRSHVINNVMVGYQAEFDPRPEHFSGGVWEEQGRGWLAKPESKGCAAMKPYQWNAYRIRAVGDHVQIWVNGVPTADFRDVQARSGSIALQVHSGADVKVSWRDIRLQDLGDGGGWKSMFDGKSLRGWHIQGEPGSWRAEDGQIVGELTKPSPYAYLATDARYADFELKCDMIFDSEEGNSGVFFRCSFPPQCAKCDHLARELPENTRDFKCPNCGGTEALPVEKRGHIHGPQAEFAQARTDNGALYDSATGKWINKDKMTDRKQDVYRFHEWNDFRLIAVGNHVRTYMNGYLISDVSDYVLPPEGVIALQLHTGGAMKVRFKNLHIRILRNMLK